MPISRRPRSRRPSALLAVLFTIAVAACTGTSESTGPISTADSRTTEAKTCPMLATGSLDLTATAAAPASPPKPAQGQNRPTPNSKLPPPVPDGDGVILDPSDFPATRSGALGAGGVPLSGQAYLTSVPVSLRAPGHTYQTAEPEVAVNGDRVLLVWNTMAAVSSDGGASYRFVDPRTPFPAASALLCCDQRAIHLPRQDLWVWILQYRADPAGDNTIRLAVARGDEEFDRLRFLYIDYGPAELGFGSGTLLDQPKVGATDRFLYVSINGFTRSALDPTVSPHTGSAIIRLDLDALADGTAASTCLHAGTNPANGLPYFGVMPTRGSGDTMYMAAHQDQALLALWRWRDADASPTFRTVAAWSPEGQPYRYPETKPYTCPRTGGDASTDWCFHPTSNSTTEEPVPGNGGRLTTGWVDRGIAGFAWNASQTDGAPFPFVWAMLIDTTKIDACATGGCANVYPLYDQRHAIQYPALGPNGDGDIGGVVITGGGDRPLGCEAVILDPATGTWSRVEVARSGEDLPIWAAGRPTSGDYLGVTTGGADPASWTGSCMTWEPGTATTDGSMLIHTARFAKAP